MHPLQPRGTSNTLAPPSVHSAHRPLPRPAPFGPLPQFARLPPKPHPLHAQHFSPAPSFYRANAQTPPLIPTLHYLVPPPASPPNVPSLPPNPLGKTLAPPPAQTQLCKPRPAKSTTRAWGPPAPARLALPTRSRPNLSTPQATHVGVASPPPAEYPDPAPAGSSSLSARVHAPLTWANRPRPLRARTRPPPPVTCPGDPAVSATPAPSAFASAAPGPHASLPGHTT